MKPMEMTYVRGINVGIAGHQCFRNSLLLVILVLPGPKSQSWDGGSSVKLLVSSRCHCSMLYMRRKLGDS